MFISGETLFKIKDDIRRLEEMVNGLERHYTHISEKLYDLNEWCEKLRRRLPNPISFSLPAPLDHEKLRRGKND